MAPLCLARHSRHCLLTVLVSSTAVVYDRTTTLLEFQFRFQSTAKPPFKWSAFGATATFSGINSTFPETPSLPAYQARKRRRRRGRRGGLHVKLWTHRISPSLGSGYPTELGISDSCTPRDCYRWLGTLDLAMASFFCVAAG